MLLLMIMLMILLMMVLWIPVSLSEKTLSLLLTEMLPALRLNGLMTLCCSS